jgi:hypothetical protein
VRPPIFAFRIDSAASSPAGSVRSAATQRACINRVSSSSGVLGTDSEESGAQALEIRVERGDIRYASVGDRRQERVIELLYAGQRLQVTGEQLAAAGVMVRSQIVKTNGELVTVNYMMHRNGNSWLISDIYLDGAISEVATRHSEFAAILKSQGIDGLIAALNRKADILTATTAKAS